ncbi:hypothetical protein [Marivirga sp.]|uniref:hypothetical protein n=1 Tax=Marivirga sp. TaxID=2018662 RepID=UPI003DA6ED4B
MALIKTGNSDYKDKSAREKIARIISISVPIATGILGICGLIIATLYILINNDIDEAKQVLQYVYTALLPIFGTWMGTVLAYYFSKENFEAANKSVEKLVSKITSDGKLEKIKVKEVMIPFQNFKDSSIVENSQEAIDALVVKDLIEKMNKDGRQRLPILLNKKAVYLFHKSTLFEYLYSNTDPDKNPPPTSSISDMLQSDITWIQQVIKNGIKFLGADANLLEAKKLMESEKACNDAMITTDGTSSGEVTGWITDKIISEKSKI